MEAVPILLRRLAAELAPKLDLEIARPIRRSRDRLLQAGELEKDVIFAAEKSNDRGAILILLDSEGSCPAELGPRILRRAIEARSDRLTRVVLAHMEFEAWFLAAASSIAGKRGLANDFKAPDNPEGIQGAKEWLKKHMKPGRTYSETADQPALASLFNIKAARAAPAFDRLFKVCKEMFQHLTELESASD